MKAMFFLVASTVLSPVFAGAPASVYPLAPDTGRTTILVNRIGPSESELFTANADGTGEHRIFQTSFLDYNASFSADGKWIVFTSERDGNSDIYRAHPDGSGIERLVQDPAFDDQAALSPDGSQLAFVSTRGSGTNDIWILDLKTRKVRNVTQSPGGDFRPAWSPDGKWIAFSSDRNTPFRPHVSWEHIQETSIYLIQPDGTGLRRLTEGGRLAGSPSWSADGKRIVFYEMDPKDTFRARFAPAPSQIVSLEVESGARTELASGPALKVNPQFVGGDRVGYLVKSGPGAGLAFTTGEQGAAGSMRSPSWSADGKQVVFHRTNFHTEKQGQPLPGIDPRFDLRFSGAFPSISVDGKVALTELNAAATNLKAAISTMNVDGSESRKVFADEAGSALAPAWSPDGQSIAFGFGTFFGARTKPGKIMLMRADGTEKKDVTDGTVNSGFPGWSPDGKQLVFRVFGAGPDGVRGLRIVNLEDLSVRTLTTEWDNFPAWSPQGDRIAFTRNSDHISGSFDIFSIRPDGTDLKQLTDAPGNDAHSAYSPDGQYILFSSSRLGFKEEAPLYDQSPQPYGELQIMNADGSGQRPLTDDKWEKASPAWVPAKVLKK